MNGLARLSLNQATVRRWTVAEPVTDAGLARAAKLVRDAGLRVTSLCRGGFVTAVEPSERAALADNRRAIDEAAALGAEVLVLVCGGLPAGDRDLDGARRRVADAVAALAPDAAVQGSGWRSSRCIPCSARTGA